MNHLSRGDISIYIALTTAILMLGSATLLSLLLARQISLTKNLVASERAFFAANAGQEEAYYRLAISSDPLNVDTIPINGTVDYTVPGGVAQSASYEGEMKLINGLPCGNTTGIFPATSGTRRRLAVGPNVCP